MLVLVAELKSVPLTVTRVLLSSPPVVASVLAPPTLWLAMKRPRPDPADGRGRDHALLQGVAAVVDQSRRNRGLRRSGPRRVTGRLTAPLTAPAP